MASRAEILDQITDISVRVLGCDEDDIAPRARFSELGSDSLTIVEIGEELGRRFDVHLSDDTIDTMRTVQDAINAVVGSAESKKKAEPVAKAAALSRPPADATERAERTPLPKEHVAGRAVGLVAWMAIIGILIGGFIGYGFSAMVSASGIDEAYLPPLNPPTAEPTPTDATPSPEPTPTTSSAPTPQPTLTTSATRVDPGERFALTGAFPELGEGVELQVQVREKGTGWDDFPITTKTRADGEFKTELYTSRTGEREFRLLNEKTGKKTPTVAVEIG